MEITPFKQKKMKTVWLPRWQCTVLEQMPNYSQFLEDLLSEHPKFQKKKVEVKTSTAPVRKKIFKTSNGPLKNNPK